MLKRQVFITFVIKYILVFNRIFPDEASCEKYLRTLHEWEGKGLIAVELATTGINTTSLRWQCAACKHIITLRSGTLFQSSKRPLMYWFTTIHLLTGTKKTFRLFERLMIAAVGTQPSFVHRLYGSTPCVDNHLFFSLSSFPFPNL